MAIDEILRNGAGTQWDRRVIDALFACRADVESDPPEGTRREACNAPVNDTVGRS